MAERSIAIAATEQLSRMLQIRRPELAGNAAGELTTKERRSEMTKMKTKLSEIARIECGTGADIADEDNYWVSFDATDDLERPVVVTVLIAKGTPIPVVCRFWKRRRNSHR